MSVQKFLGFENDVKLFTALSASSGAGDASKILCTNSLGIIDTSFLPSVDAGQIVVTGLATDDLIAGDFINFYNSGGNINVRKADNNTGKIANGFVLETFLNSDIATVYVQGENNLRSGLIPGTIYFLSSEGSVTLTAPNGSGKFVQKLGIAIDENTINFEYNRPVYISDLIGNVDDTTVVSMWTSVY